MTTYPEEKYHGKDGMFDDDLIRKIELHPESGLKLYSYEFINV